jgi:exodeoxyribonuclease V beta subunit
MNSLDLGGPLPAGRFVIEASAGTGKTYSLTALLARAVVERGVTVDQILVITFTRAAAAELRDRARTMMGATVQALREGVVPDHAPWMQVVLDADDDERVRRLRRGEQALARFDDMTVTTIHGFCQQALAQLGLRSTGADVSFVESVSDVVQQVCRDLLLDALADAPDDVAPTVPTDALERAINAAVHSLLTNPDAVVVPEPTTDSAVGRVRLVVDRVLAEVDRRLASRGLVGYDQLVSRVRDLLRDPDHGDAAAAQLATRYPMVMVDEFQDTDPAQWDIIQRAFGGGTLVTVGDPKQAIYRFRGADVDAYLRAVDQQPTVVLDTNYRSHPDVLRGVASLFEGATLGDERIPFRTVRAAGDVQSGERTAVVIRAVPNSPSLLTRSAGAVGMPAARNLVLADLTHRVGQLLQSYKPGDLAVLVATHADAAAVADALRAAAVPAVRTRTGSVLLSPAADQWRMLFDALARPAFAPAVRAAMFGWFLPTSMADVVSDDTVAAAQAQCRQWGFDLRGMGVAAFYDALRSDVALLTRLLSMAEGERHLTDLDHIAELLAERLHGVVCQPALVLRTLDELRLDDEARSEHTMRRIDSDADAVQVTTIHGAKGLEYPVVLVPFAFAARPNESHPYTFTTDTADGDQRRTIDVASVVSAKDQTRRAAQRSTAGDQMRLLYVALTRAQHHVDVWWANTTRANSSALGRLLLDRMAAGPALNNALPRNSGKGEYEKATQQLRLLVEHSEGALGLVELPPEIETFTWQPEQTLAPSLAVAPTGGRRALADPAWRTWSFTALTSALDIDHQSSSASPPPGGGDEAIGADDSVAAQPAQGGADASCVEVSPLADMVAGASFGTLVHSVLEHVDFQSDTLDSDLLVVCEHGVERSGLSLSPRTLAEGLACAVRAPLGEVFGGRSLASFSRLHRVDEMVFDLRLARFPAAEVAEVLARTLPPNDPLQPWASSLAEEFVDVHVDGWLTGSIDALLRMPLDGGGHRYVVVDYKTNRLHRPGATQAEIRSAYSGGHLVAAMTAHHYPLQAAVYLVATHRLLQARLGSRYHPEVHLGGAAYLFVRGMTPSVDHHLGDPPGVFMWTPPVDAVVALDELFAGAPR